MTASCRSGRGLAARGPGRVPDPPAAGPAPGPRPVVARRHRVADPQLAGHGPDDLIRRAHRELAARVQHQHSRGAFCLVQVAGGHDDRSAVGRGPGDQRPQVGPAHRVHPGGRLVQHQQGRAGQHGRDHAELLPHPAGQLPGQPVPRRGQPGPAQERGAALGRGRRREPVGGRAEGQVLRDGQVRIGSRAGRQVADVPLRRPPDYARAGGERAAQAAQQRAAPSAVAADHRADLARPRPEGHLVQRQAPAVPDGHPLGSPPFRFGGYPAAYRPPAAGRLPAAGRPPAAGRLVAAHRVLAGSGPAPAVAIAGAAARRPPRRPPVPAGDR